MQTEHLQSQCWNLTSFSCLFSNTIFVVGFLIAVKGSAVGMFFKAAVGQSYLCNAEKDIYATKLSENAHSISVELVDVQIQAFSKEKKPTSKPVRVRIPFLG